MKQYLLSKNSDSLLLFFAGWGCDEYEFEHLDSESDILILYEYNDLNLDFDFSKYKKVDLITFSAGVFVASVLNFDFKINRKVAIDGNPYLFDEYFGLSKSMQEILYNITEDYAEVFARNYLVKTDEEYKNFHPSMRTLASCKHEFDSLRQIYNSNKSKIKDIFDFVIFGDSDPIFNVTAQKEFFKDRLRIVKNARHNPFFRIKKFEDVFDLGVK